MRIWFVCDEYPPGRHGGIGTVTQTLARGLVRLGHEVSVAGIGVEPQGGVGAPSAAGDGGGEEWDEGVRVRRLPASPGRLGWVADRLRLARLVRAACRAGAVDLVEVPDWGGPAAGWPPLPVPVVARLHGSATYLAAETEQPLHWTAALLERRSLRRAEFLASPSAYTAGRVARLFGLAVADIAVLHNAVEVVPPPDVPRARARVVFAGTLARLKGVLSLAAAWPHVVASHPAVELHLYGKDGRAPTGGSMRAFLDACLQERLPAGARVTFHDHVSRDALQRAFAEATVAVFPSYVETFACAPMEAMACGCPTIYSSRGSGRELMHDGVDGLLVDPDDVAGLAAAIGRVLDDGALARRLGAAGCQRVLGPLSAAAAARRTAAFYERCRARFTMMRARGPARGAYDAMRP